MEWVLKIRELLQMPSPLSAAVVEEANRRTSPKDNNERINCCRRLLIVLEWTKIIDKALKETVKGKQW